MCVGGTQASRTHALFTLLALLVLPACGNQDADSPVGSNRSSAPTPQLEVTIAGRPANHFVLRKDMFEALTKPGVATATQADWLSPEDLVLGLEAGGEARAYPLRQMAYHHVVNDVLGTRALLVTFCSLSGNALVFDRRAGGQTDEFGVAGWLQGTLLLYDKRTGSTWSQVTGRCIDGFRQGEQLERLLPARLLAWADWRRAQPGTRVMRPRAGRKDRYPVETDWVPGSTYVPTGVRATLDPALVGAAAHELVIAFASQGNAHTVRLPDEDERARVLRIDGRDLLVWRVRDPFDVRVFVLPEGLARGLVRASGERVRLGEGTLTESGLCETGPMKGTQLELIAHRLLEQYAWRVHHADVIAHDN